MCSSMRSSREINPYTFETVSDNALLENDLLDFFKISSKKSKKKETL